MKDFNYEKTFELMCAFQALNPLKGSIIKFLFGKYVFTGNYTDLALLIGKKKKSVSSVRKAVKELEKIGIVYIVYIDNAEFDDDGNLIKSVPMKKVYLLDNWMESLLKWYRREL